MTDINPKVIRDLAKILKDSDLTEIEVDGNGLRIKLVREKVIQSNMVNAFEVPTHQIPSIPEVKSELVSDSKKDIVEENLETVKSPIVGTAYLSPQPGAPTFVSSGSKVNKGDTLMIIEAMKVMNPIKSPVSGVIKEILVSDGKPVEYDEILVKIEL